MNLDVQRTVLSVLFNKAEGRNSAHSCDRNTSTLWWLICITTKTVVSFKNNVWLLLSLQNFQRPVKVSFPELSVSPFVTITMLLMVQFEDSLKANHFNNSQQSWATDRLFNMHRWQEYPLASSLLGYVADSGSLLADDGSNVLRQYQQPQRKVSMWRFSRHPWVRGHTSRPTSRAITRAPAIFRPPLAIIQLRVLVWDVWYV